MQTHAAPDYPFDDPVDDCLSDWKPLGNVTIASSADGHIRQDDSIAQGSVMFPRDSATVAVFSQRLETSVTLRLQFRSKRIERRHRKLRAGELSRTVTIESPVTCTLTKTKLP
jgi:hypothetical protein